MRGMTATRSAVFSRRSSRLVTLAGAATLVTALVVGGGPAVGSSRDDVRDRQGNVREQLDESQENLEHISGELSAAVARLGELEEQVPAARAAVDEAAEAAEAAKARDAELAAELDVASAALEATTAELGARQAEADDTQRRATSVVRETYRGSDLNDLAILVEATDPQEYADMLLLAQAAKKAQDRTMARLQVQQAEIRNAEARQQAQEDELERLKVEAEAQVDATLAAEQAARDAQAALESLVADQASAVAAVEAEKAAEEGRIAELNAESEALEQRLVQIAEEERAAAAVAAERAAAEARRQAEQQQSNGGGGGGGGGGGAAPAPPAGGDTLSTPTSGRISSPFGYRIHPILGYRRLHSGTDFAAPCGTPVVAAASGTVVSTGWAGGYGNQVVVSHGILRGVSLATTYNHLSGYAVRGGAVSRGQVIGYIGTTGSSTGCHLHFETREAGTPVDPMKWL